jgi:glycosyltransferase involved in cell wall biosynthesis
MPKVSIIVPVYNVEKYLEKCLDSLINQTLKDIEIICINDGSLDNSINILEKYAIKDNRLKIISQKNAGLSAARNTGINAASGDYIGFCDSDDWVSLDFYEKLYKCAVQNNTDIACGEIIKIRKGKEKKFLTYNNETIAKTYLEKLQSCNVPDYSYVWNKIYRLSKIKKHNLYFEEGITYEDIIFSPQALFYLDKTVTIKNTYYYYLSRKTSITHNSNNDHDGIKSSEFAKNFIQSHGVNIDDVKTKVYELKILGLSIKLKIKNNKFIKLNISKI